MTKKKSSEKIRAFLGGEIIRSDANLGTFLSRLLRSIYSGTGVNILQWKNGLDAYLDDMVRRNEIDKDKRGSTLGNFTDAISSDTMSWKTFIGGIKVYAYIYYRTLKSIRFQVEVIRVDERGIETTDVFSQLIHENKRAGKIPKKADVKTTETKATSSKSGEVKSWINKLRK